MKRSSTAINQSTSMLGSSKSKMSRLASSKSMQKGQKQGKKLTEPESAAGYHMIRSMDGKRKYIPLEDFSKERRKSKNQLMSIKEVERPDSSESDSDKTEISGTETEKSYASSESDSDDLGSSTSKDDNDDAESVEEESSDSDAEVRHVDLPHVISSAALGLNRVKAFHLEVFVLEVDATFHLVGALLRNWEEG